MKDLRDPKKLGEVLLGTGLGVRVAADIDPRVPDYDANPTPLEKYGRPQDLPSTLPN